MKIVKFIKGVWKFFKSCFKCSYWVATSNRTVIQSNIRCKGNVVGGNYISDGTEDKNTSMIVGGDLVIINGKKYTGQNIKVRNGVVSINGKEVDRIEDKSITINSYY